MAGRSTVVRIPVEVPDAGGLLVVGDLMVVSKVEPFDAPPEGGAVHPLVWKGVLLYPSFGEPISLAARPELTFALPMTASGLVPSATLELVRRGQVLATLPLPADAPLADGRLVIVGRLPLAQIPSGAYDLRVSVDAGGHTVSRIAAFTLTR